MRSSSMALFRHYMEHYLAKREDVNEEDDAPRAPAGGQAGVPIELYFFLRTKDWIPYEHSWLIFSSTSMRMPMPSA